MISLPININIDLQIASKNEALEAFEEALESLRDHVEQMSERFFEDATLVDERFKVGYSVLWDFVSEEEADEE